MDAFHPWPLFFEPISTHSTPSHFSLTSKGDWRVSFDLYRHVSPRPHSFDPNRPLFFRRISTAVPPPPSHSKGLEGYLCPLPTRFTPALGFRPIPTRSTNHRHVQSTTDSFEPPAFLPPLPPLQKGLGGFFSSRRTRRPPQLARGGAVLSHRTHLFASNPSSRLQLQGGAVFVTQEPSPRRLLLLPSARRGAVSSSRTRRLTPLAFQCERGRFAAQPLHLLPPGAGSSPRNPIPSSIPSHVQREGETPFHLPGPISPSTYSLLTRFVTRTNLPLHILPLASNCEEASFRHLTQRNRPTRYTASPTQPSSQNASQMGLILFYTCLC
jgi:hypothetical protein